AVNINLFGVLNTCHETLPHMIDRGSGRIVNLASDAGRVGSAGEAVYAAAKGGIIAFSKTIARESARYGLNVDCMSPGPTETAPVHRHRPSRGGNRGQRESAPRPD